MKQLLLTIINIISFESLPKGVLKKSSVKLCDTSVPSV